MAFLYIFYYFVLLVCQLKYARNVNRILLHLYYMFRGGAEFDFFYCSRLMNFFVVLLKLLVVISFAEKSLKKRNTLRERERERLDKLADPNVWVFRVLNFDKQMKVGRRRPPRQPLRCRN